MALNTLSRGTETGLNKNSGLRRTLLAAAIAAVAGGCHDDIKRVGEPVVTSPNGPTATTGRGSADAGRFDAADAISMDEGSFDVSGIDVSGIDDDADGSTESGDQGVVPADEGTTSPDEGTGKDDGESEDTSSGFDEFSNDLDAIEPADEGEPQDEGEPDAKQPADTGESQDEGITPDPSTVEDVEDTIKDTAPSADPEIQPTTDEGAQDQAGTPDEGTLSIDPGTAPDKEMPQVEDIAVDLGGTPDQNADAPDEGTPDAEEANDTEGIPDQNAIEDTKPSADPGTQPIDAGETSDQGNGAPDEGTPPGQDATTDPGGTPDTGGSGDPGTLPPPNECFPAGSFKQCIANHPNTQKPAGCKVEGTSACETQIDGSLKYGECKPDPDEVANSNEQCNYLDDDCDGQTDENFNINGNSILTGCTTQVPNAKGENKTCPGVVTCASESEATCLPITDPGQPEECNMIDDDCDGAVDEFCVVGVEDEIPCDTGKPGICAQGKMDKFCLSEEICIIQTKCKDDVAPITEICNGIDENCNGIIDDGFSVGQGCVEVCGANTAYQCTPDGKGTICVAEKDANGQVKILNFEMCDKGDENCNGIDEKTEPCENDTDGDGFLDSQEKPFCGIEGTKDPNVYPNAPEICDGVRNSCDGGPIDQANDGKPVCNKENAAPNGCFDGKDNDGDGDTDTKDTDCQ